MNAHIMNDQAANNNLLRLGFVLLVAAFLTIHLEIVLADDTEQLNAKWSAQRFDREISTIFASRCLDCHSGQEPKGGLDLSDDARARTGGESGVAIVSGKPDESLILRRISDGEMPPNDPLPEAERVLIRDWIAGGAVWGTSPIDPFRISSAKRAGYDWWSLRPIQRLDVPKSGSVWVKGAIDEFVLRRLIEAGLEPSPQASDHVIVRRLHFDLLGLPPQPQDVESFEKQSIGDFIDRLLDSHHFGERWGRHWLDVVRFGESQGFERDKLRENSWQYRDWVIDAFNDDMPYDEFVRQQIAGDVLHPDDNRAITATGFLVAGPWDEVGQSMQSAAMRAVVRQDEIEDYVGTIGQTFLGLTINCARCHDHKFDPIRQSEYYQLASAVDGVRHGERLVSSREDKQKTYSVYAVQPATPETSHVLLRGNPATKGDAVSPGGVAAVSGVNSDFGLAQDAPDADRRRQLAKWITASQNPLFARVIVNRLWHYHFGTGLVETPNDFGFSGGRPTHPQLLDYLASELIDSGWSLKHVHRLIVSSATYLQSSRYRSDCASVDADNRLLWRKNAMRLEAEALRDSILAVAGQLNRTQGGPPYRDFKTFTNNSQFYEMTDVDSPDVYRRTVYRTWIRSGRNHMLDAFDCPDPSTTAPKRAVTTTPIQSLTLMNNSFVLRMADRFAERVTKDVRADAGAQVNRVYQLAYGRAPNDREASVAQAFVDAHVLPAFCRVVFNSNEFIYVD